MKVAQIYQSCWRDLGSAEQGETIKKCREWICKYLCFPHI